MFGSRWWLVWTLALGPAVAWGGSSGALAHAGDGARAEEQAAKGGDPAPIESPIPERRDPVAGDEVVVVMASGERVEGEFVARTDRDLEIRISGVTLRIGNDTIERVILLDPPAVRYKRMRSLINDEDTDRIVMLADWLRRQRMYDEALHELEHVLSVSPNDGEALRLRATVEQLKALEERRRERAAAPPVTPRAEEGVAPAQPRRPTPGEFPLLRPDQINLMKVFEIDLNHPPRMVVPREVVDRLLREYAESPLIPTTREGREALYRRSPAQLLDLMYRLRARALYEQVQVLELPRSMRLFRDHVHAAWLVNSCATTRCHGGREAGRLQLTNYRPTSEESVFTNFLIIDRFRTASGEALIDYAEPERSVLLQMGLPRDDALHPHPVVAGWNPVFRTREARRFAQAVDWIRSMYRPRPDYGVVYSPPGESVPRSEGGDGDGEPVER